MSKRLYQEHLKRDIHDQWDCGAANVIAVLPTGGGKTKIFTDIIKGLNLPSCAIAHRKELVGQISLALTKQDVYHNIIGPSSTVRDIVRDQQRVFKKVRYSPDSNNAVAGVDTIIKRGAGLSRWLPHVKLWVQDEAHHVLKNNKWGKAAALFPNARGLGVTATPQRLDGSGLGRGADGLFDSMCVGPSMRELIDLGYLTDYRIFAPPTDLNLKGLKISASGDFSPPQLQQRVSESHLVGDVVDHYFKFAPGKLGVTFVNSVETGREVTTRFKARGVAAEFVDANTPAAIRAEIIRRFANREVTMLVNVDLFGEGFDLPALEVVILARPTKSFVIYSQQIGRVLRLMLPDYVLDNLDDYTPKGRLAMISGSTKPYGLIIDAVSNCFYHGLPDISRPWSLERPKKRERTKNPEDIKLKSCINPQCLAVYPAYKTHCPHCGDKPPITARSGPHCVDGDLQELDTDTLRLLRGEVQRIDAAPQIPQGVNLIVAASIRKKHATRQDAQGDLRESIKWWAGVYEFLGYSLREIQKLFYLTFGHDVLTAQTLGATKAAELQEEIDADFNRLLTKHNLIKQEATNEIARVG